MLGKLAGKVFLIGLGGILVVVAIAAWQLAFATHEGVKTGTIVAGVPCTPSNPIGDGCQARLGSLAEPFSVSIDRDYNLFVADKDNNRIRRMTPGWDEVVNGHFDEIISTVAGTGTAGFSGDGGPATSALLDNPENVFAHKGTGAIYIADSENHRVRKVTPGVDGLVNGSPDDIISTVAGNGTEATGPCLTGPATSTPLGEVESVHVDDAGNLYIANAIESGGIALGFICKVDTSGNATNIAGKICVANEPFGDGGPATVACIREIEGITLDRTGNIYIADNLLPTESESRRAELRKIDTLGIITTVGTGLRLFGVEADRLGRVFVADYASQVLMYDPVAGTFTNAAGAGINFTQCPSLPAIIDHIPGGVEEAVLCWVAPYGVAIDQTGDVYVTDTNVGDKVWRVESIAEPCPDLNQDGTVNTLDIGILVANFGDTPFLDGNSDGIEGWTVRRDISRNHVIDMADIDAVVAAFGNKCWW